MSSRPACATVLASLTLMAVSCGTPAAPVAQESTEIGDRLPPVEGGATLPPVERVRLSIDDALLADGDAPDPWDMQKRNVETFAHDIGPNQTDCGPYWEYERLGRLQGGETMWWRDGGNLNNMVRREDEPGQAADLMRVLADLPQSCPVTAWSEGDSFTIEPLDLSGVPGSDGIVALSIDHVRTDEVLWLAFAQRGDLISELRVTMWPEFESGRIPSFSRIDFGTVAATMSARLAAAGSDDATPPSAPTTTVPGERPGGSVSTMPPVAREENLPELEPLPPGLTIPPIELPPTTVAPLSDLAALLLVTDEMPEGWFAERAIEYDDADPDAEALAGCPESAIIIELDARFEYSATLLETDAESSDGAGVQFISALDDDAEGATIADSFLALDGCDGGDEWGRYLLAATEVDVAGADAAVVVTVDQIRPVDNAGEEDAAYGDETTTDQYVLALATVGSTLTTFSLLADAPVLDLLQRAVDKIVAAG